MKYNIEQDNGGIEPQVDDIIYVILSRYNIPPGKYILKPCDCGFNVNSKTNWPIGPACGPHIYTEDGRSIQMVAYGMINKVWYFTGTLIRGEEKSPVKIDLKKLNSAPSATNCAQCKGPLKEPWINIKFCPVCEK